MPFSDYLRRRALVHHSGGLSARAIVGVLAVEGPSATRQGIASLADSRSARARLQVASMSARLLQIEPFRLLAKNETARNETARHENKRNGNDIKFFRTALRTVSVRIVAKNNETKQ